MKEMRTLTIDGVTYKIVDGSVGSLDDLRTANKSSIVSAVNEVSEKIDLASRLSLGVHTDDLVYLFIDGAPVGSGIELSSGGISGYVDSENNIIINGLPDGSYTVKYEMEDGSTIDIGALEVGDEPAQAYTNQIPASINADGDLFVGTNGEKGYKSGYRLSLSSGTEKALAGYSVTGFIPAKNGDVIRVKNVAVTEENNTNIACYDADKQPILRNSTCGTSLYNLLVTLGTMENGVYTGTLNGTASQSMESGSGLAYIRVGSTSITDDSVITINQEIV